MFSKVMPDQMDQILRDEPSLVLVAYLEQGFLYPEQRRMLAGLAADHVGILRVCFLDGQQFAGVAARYGIGGAPTYILFRAGREIGRLLGITDLFGIKGFIRASVEADAYGTAC
jgi:hypothetical protein